jgi:hypothetical protein
MIQSDFTFGTQQQAAFHSSQERVEQSIAFSNQVNLPFARRFPLSAFRFPLFALTSICVR